MLTMPLRPAGKRHRQLRFGGEDFCNLVIEPPVIQPFENDVGLHHRVSKSVPVVSGSTVSLKYTATINLCKRVHVQRKSGRLVVFARDDSVQRRSNSRLLEPPQFVGTCKGAGQ